MEIIQFDLTGRGQTDIAMTVYASLTGQLVPGCALPWIEDIFVPGHPYYESYCQMRQAYDRLLFRLGETDEDRDAEVMIDALLEHGKIIALEMFRYGMDYQKMLSK